MSELNIPGHWAEASINDINNLQYGKNLSTSELTPDGYPVFGANGQIGFYHEYHYEEPQILITCRGATCGTINISLPESFVTNNSIAIIPKENSLYRKDFLRFALMMINPATIISGSAQPQITLGNLEKINLPIPPIQEQERIVQKIESCFQKIDETEKALNEVEVLLTKYRESLLAKAFRGELIPQDPKDEPASKLLGKIRAERARNSNGKKVQEFAPTSADEKPFDLPDGWEWVRIYEACEEIEAGSTPEPKLMLDKGDVQFLKVYNLNFDGTLNDQNKPVFISCDTNDRLLRRSISRTGDVLLNIVGPPFGKISIIPNSIQVCNHNQAIVHFRVNRALSNQYLAYWLQSDFMNQWMLRTSRRTSGQWNLSVNNCRSFFIPVPPLKEQMRIISKINSSFNSIGNLVKTKEVKKNLLSKLKEAILSKAFQGTLVSRFANEGTGQELLEKILKSKKNLSERSVENPPKPIIKKTVKKKAKK